MEVSGGEAQKIAIARALYKDAPFIVLDESTAALDPIAEAEIHSKFDEIAGDKTAIYISHDETLIERTANKIIHIEQIRRKTKSRFCIANTSYAEYRKNTLGRYVGRFIVWKHMD